MTTVLVLYATTEGHTRKIAGEIAKQVRDLGHTPTVLNSAAIEAGTVHRGAYDVAIGCGSVHQG